MTKLTDCISPAFFEIHQAIKTMSVREVVLTGGRGSTKSSFISVEIVLELIKHPNVHAAVFRRYGNTLRNSVFYQLQWAINALGLANQFVCTVSPMSIVYKPTGQQIFFKGLDDPFKSKGIKAPFGYIGILWFEELDQFRGEDDVLSVEQSNLRGGDWTLVFKSFNPPPMRRNWANQYAQEKRAGKVVHHSTYLTVPPAWLGERFIDDAEFMKNTKPKKYAHQYMGEIIGTGKEVFSNIIERTITAADMETFGYALHGVDWGWYPDPWAYNACSYDAARRTLYIFDELEAVKTANKETAQLLLDKGIYDLIIADSAEPKSVGDYKAFGLTCKGAIKGPGSVKRGTNWMQALDAIVIDPERAPRTFKEFTEYEYEENKQGEIIGTFPDFANHHIDAVRYATSLIWRQKGA